MAICATFPKSCCGCRPHLRARRRALGRFRLCREQLGVGEPHHRRLSRRSRRLQSRRLPPHHPVPRHRLRDAGRRQVLGSLGAVFDWRGTTASKGRFNGTGPEPAMYSLNFQGGAQEPAASHDLRRRRRHQSLQSAEEAAKSARHPHHQGAARGRARPDDGGVSLCALRQSQWRPEGLRSDHSGVRRRGAIQSRSSSRSAR